MVIARCSSQVDHLQESVTTLTKSLNRNSSSSSSSKFPSIASMLPCIILVLVALAAAADARSLHRPSRSADWDSPTDFLLLDLVLLLLLLFPTADWDSAAPADSDAARLGRVFRRSARSGVDVDRHQLLEDIIRRLEAVDAAERMTGELEELEELDGEQDWTARRRSKKAGIMGLDNLDFTSAAFDRWSNYLNSVGSNGLPPPAAGGVPAGLDAGVTTRSGRSGVLESRNPGIPAGLPARMQRLGGSSGSGAPGSGAANHKLLMSLINAG